MTPSSKPTPGSDPLHDPLHLTPSTGVACDAASALGQPPRPHRGGFASGQQPTLQTASKPESPGAEPFANRTPIGLTPSPVSGERPFRAYREDALNAGPIRNQEIIDTAAEMCLAFYRAISSSKGTKDCVRRTIAAGIPTYLIDSEKAEPKRLRAGDARLR
jgi:hypothetical protein